MHIRKIVTMLAFVACLPAFGADTIAVAESRPLGKLAVQLAQRYGYLVTYEEAPYDSVNLRPDPRPNGVKFLYPDWKAIVFHVPENPADAASAAPKKTASLGPQILEPLVKEYNESGNPEKFSVIYEGDYAHIVPAIRRDGKDFEPILSTRIPSSIEVRSCSDILNDLLSRITTARGVTILLGRVPVNSLIPHQCGIFGTDLTAREILSQILDQAGTPGVPGVKKTRFTWTLMYDANWNKYFLSTILVPDLSQPAKTSSGPATKPVEPPPSLPAGQSRRFGVKR